MKFLVHLLIALSLLACSTSSVAASISRYAKCDGKANATAGVTKAIAALPANGTLVIRGSCRLHSTITIEKKPNITIVGDGWGSGFVANDASFDLFSLVGSDGFTFDNLLFQGASVDNEGAKAIKSITAPSSGVRVLRSRFRNLNNGIVISHEDSNGWLISGNDFRHILSNASGNGIAIYTIGQLARIVHNHCEDVHRHCVYLSASTPTGASFTLVQGNISVGPVYEAIALFSQSSGVFVRGVIVSSNLILNPHIGIGIDQNVSGTSVLGNVIIGATGKSISIEGDNVSKRYARNVSIIANTIGESSYTEGHIFSLFGISNTIALNNIYHASSIAKGITLIGNADSSGNLVADHNFTNVTTPYDFGASPESYRVRP